MTNINNLRHKDNEDVALLEYLILNGFDSALAKKSENPINNNIIKDSGKELLEYLTKIFETEEYDQELKKKFIKNINLMLMKHEQNLSRVYWIISLCMKFLNFYLHANYIGPNMNLLPIEEKEFLDKVEGMLIKNAIKIKESLDLEGENINQFYERFYLIWILLNLIENVETIVDIENHQVVINILKIRIYMIYHRMFNNSIYTIRSKTMKLIDQTVEDLENEKLGLSKTLIGTVYLEMAIHLIQINDHKKSKAFLEKTMYMFNIKLNLTGKLGKRTKYQENFISQLILSIENLEKNETKTILNSESVSVNPNVIPENIQHYDDTLLERIDFVENLTSGENKIQNDNKLYLNHYQQCLALAYAAYKFQFMPIHELRNEEIMAFITSIINIKEETSWNIFTQALLYRSRIEFSKSRLIERSILQLEALYNQIDNYKDKDPLFEERIKYIWLIDIKSKFEMKDELAQRYIKIGLIRSALEMYKELKYVEKIVECHIILEEKETALELVNSVLEQDKSNSRLLCLKGDLLRDINYYYEAWEVSGHKSALAMRSLGNHYFDKGDYENCIKCLEKALSINPLYELCWYYYGISGLKLNNNKIAQKGFVKCIEINNDNYCSWCNLGSTYYMLKKYYLAAQCFSQGLRIESNNFKLWDNLLTCELNLAKESEAKFEQCTLHWINVVNAYRKVIEIKVRNKHKTEEEIIDKKILLVILEQYRHMADMMNNPDISNNSDQSSEFRKRTIMRLLNTIDNLVLNNIKNNLDEKDYAIHMLLFQYYKIRNLYNPSYEMLVNKIEHIKSAYRTCTRIDFIEKKRSRYNDDLLKIASTIVTLRRELIENESEVEYNTKAIDNHLSKFTVKTILSKIYHQIVQSDINNIDSEVIKEIEKIIHD